MLQNSPLTQPPSAHFLNMVQIWVGVSPWSLEVLELQLFMPRATSLIQHTQNQALFPPPRPPGTSKGAWNWGKKTELAYVH